MKKSVAVHVSFDFLSLRRSKCHTLSSFGFSIFRRRVVDITRVLNVTALTRARDQHVLFPVKLNIAHVLQLGHCSRTNRTSTVHTTRWYYSAVILTVGGGFKLNSSDAAESFRKRKRHANFLSTTKNTSVENNNDWRAVVTQYWTIKRVRIYPSIQTERWRRTAYVA